MKKVKARDVYSDIVFSKIMGEMHRENHEEEKKKEMEERRKNLSNFIDELISIFSNEDGSVLTEIQENLISNWMKYNTKDVLHAIIQVEPYIEKCAAVTRENWSSLKKKFKCVF